MPTVLDTASIRPSERFAWWREVVCRSFVHLDVDPTGQCEAFRARISTAVFAAASSPESKGVREPNGSPLVQASRVEASSQRVTRSEQRLGDDSGEHTIAMLQCVGQARVTQDGSVVAMRPGAIAAVDSRRPYRIDFEGPFDQIVVKVPTSALRARLDGQAPRVVRSLDAQALLGARLLQPVVDALLVPVHVAHGERLARLAVDLLALTLAPQEAGSPRSIESPSADGRVARAHAFMLEWLHDPALGVARIAAAQGVSPRLLQRLFADRGLKLSRLILETRLDACWTALQDPAQRGESVLQIALAHGFSDPSHFARAFRMRFGVSPSAMRAASRPGDLSRTASA